MAQLRPFSAQATQALEQFLFLPERTLAADATLVLGMKLWQRPADRAIALYRQGISGRLVFSGGFNASIGHSEGRAMAEYAQSQGVAAEHILIDETASNTRENCIHAHRLLSDAGIGVRRLNIVAIHFHMRRALLTAEDIFGADLSLGIANYPSIHYTDASWHESERGRSDALGEIAKIRLYYPQRLPPALLAIFQEHGA